MPFSQRFQLRMRSSGGCVGSAGAGDGTGVAVVVVRMVANKSNWRRYMMD